jgi:hypothetical protein
LKKSGKELRGPCPIHQGKRDSLAINMETGAWYCHSGCDRGGTIFDFETELTGVNGKAARDAVLATIGRSVERERQVAATYDYVGEDGALLFQVVRFNPKGFSQRRPDGRGGWIWNLQNTRRVLYRLPVVLAAPVVFLVEGEKDADSLNELGVVATCNPMGALKWKPVYNEFLRGKQIFIVPDNDDKGRQHAADVLRSLTGAAASVKLVTLPGAKDASEWIEHGGTLDALIALTEGTEADSAPPAPFGEFDINEWFAAYGIQAHGPLPYSTGKQMWVFACLFCGHAQASILEMHNGARVFHCDGCGHCGWKEFQARVEGWSSGANATFNEDAKSSDAWPDPIPLRSWVVPAIEAQWIPGALGDMAVAVAAATETPLELAVLVGAPVVSCCIAGKVEVEIEAGYVEPVNLYGVAALESGARKTAVFEEMRGPLTAYESSERRRLQPAMKLAINKRKTIEERIGYLRKKAAKHPLDTSILNEIAEEEGTLPEIPQIPQLWTQDVTQEKLADLLKHNRERMGIFSDEGGFFDLIGGRYSSGVPNLDIYLQGYSRSPIRVNRVSRPDPIFLERPVLSIALSPQPAVLERLRDTPAFRGRGLLARFFYALPQSPLGNRKLDPQPVTAETRDAYRSLITELIQLTPPSVDDVWQPWRLKLSNEAYTAWKQFQRGVESMMRDGGKLEHLRDWGSKLPGGVARLAGVFHAVVVNISQTDAEISLDTIEHAINLGTALIPHARAAFDLMERDPNVDHALKILEWVRRERLKIFTARDCFCALQSRLKQMAVLRPVLALLVEHDYLRALPKTTGEGRPSEPYAVNPRIWQGSI